MNGWGGFDSVNNPKLPNLQLQALLWNICKCFVAADQGGLQCHCMGRDHHVKVAEVDALRVQIAAQFAITGGSSRIPWQHIHVQKHLCQGVSQGYGLPSALDAVFNFGQGHAGDSHLPHWQFG